MPEYEFKTQKTERDGPRPVADPGTYAARIIFTERLEYKAVTDDQGKPLENAGLKITLALLDPGLEDVRVRENVNIWHHKPEVAERSESVLRMIFEFCGIRTDRKFNTDHLKGCKVGVTLEKAYRFDDAGNRIEFNEVKRWHPGPVKPPPKIQIPNPTQNAKPPLEGQKPSEASDLWFA